MVRVESGRGLEEAIKEELSFSASVVLSRTEVVPRYRIMVPGATDYLLFLPMPDDRLQRRRRQSLVSGFMAWKGADGYVLSCELISPDCVVALGVTRCAVVGAMRPIVRKPLSLGPLSWLSEAECGGDLTDLLPPRDTEVSLSMLADLERVFGPQGEFAVERLDS